MVARALVLAILHALHPGAKSPGIPGLMPVSCGPWQLRCYLSGTPAADAATWLGIVRRAGLVAVDSSPTRALRRRAEAAAALAAAQ